jgi:hypothetical protein
VRDDALPIGRLLWVGVAIALAVATAIAVVLAILAHRRVPVGGVLIDKPAQLGADLPMLQTAPQPDLAAYKDAKLHALHWVDAASGVAHIPIETAMALQAARAASAGASR